MAPATIVWFRQDLRVEDNPALRAAASRGPVVPVYVAAPEEEGAWPPGGASRWWLHHSLQSLSEELRKRGAELILRRGPTFEALTALAEEAGADAVFWNRRYEPAIVQRDARIKAGLKPAGFEAESFNGSLLFEPWEVRTRAGAPFKVFTPFWKACRSRAEPRAPRAAPRKLTPVRRRLASLPLDELELAPKPDWASGLGDAWRPGVEGARAALERFLEEGVGEYLSRRDVPAAAGTSRLSPHLHFGEISPRAVWHAVREQAAQKAAGGEKGWAEGPESYLRQLGWREFAFHLLFHFPHTAAAPLREEFARLPWRKDEKALAAWRKGRTGYPFIDAGMRELWTTGWMHNRARMAAASFLVKDLLISWRQGAEWFWDTLVDADLANNTLGWQWTAGCGADAAPYFRVFNPVTQGEKFDPEGCYVRRWVPELKALPGRWIHKPWKAPEAALAEAGIALGRDYPEPMVDHAEARRGALAAWRRIR